MLSDSVDNEVLIVGADPVGLLARHGLTDVSASRLRSTMVHRMLAAGADSAPFTGSPFSVASNGAGFHDHLSAALASLGSRFLPAGNFRPEL